MPRRRHRVTRRRVRAGCTTCSGKRVLWADASAQGLAAQHTDAEGHRTWVEVEMSLEYLPPDGVRGRRTRRG